MKQQTVVFLLTNEETDVSVVYLKMLERILSDEFII